LTYFYNSQESHCHTSQYARSLLVTDSRDRRDRVTNKMQIWVIQIHCRSPS